MGRWRSRWRSEFHIELSPAIRSVEPGKSKQAIALPNCEGLLPRCPGPVGSRHCAFRGWAGLRGSIEVDAVRSKVFANFGLVSTILVSQAMEAEVLSELQNRKVAFEHADVESRGSLALTSGDYVSLWSPLRVMLL